MKRARDRLDEETRPDSCVFAQIGLKKTPRDDDFNMA